VVGHVYYQEGVRAYPPSGRDQLKRARHCLARPGFDTALRRGFARYRIAE